MTANENARCLLDFFVHPPTNRDASSTYLVFATSKKLIGHLRIQLGAVLNYRFSTVPKSTVKIDSQVS